MKKIKFFKNAGIVLIVLLLLGTSIILTTAKYDEDQNILFAQNPPDLSNQTVSYVSDKNSFTQIVIDDFWDVQHPIHEINWWGNGFVINIDTWVILAKCESTDMIFDIVFYEDLNGEPDEVVCSYHNVTPTVTDSGIIYYSKTLDEYFSLMYFEVSELSPPCILSDGWISIQAVDGDECTFVWRVSREGNLQSYVGVDFYSIHILRNSDFCFVLRTDVPEMKTLDGSSTGYYGEEQNYTIMADGYEDYDMYYYIDWDDGNVDEWIGPNPAGEEVNVTHTWLEEGNYTIQVKAKNSMDMESDYMTLEVSMSEKSKVINIPLFLQRLFQRYPILEKILNQIITIN